MNLAVDPPVPDNDQQPGVDNRLRPPNGTRINSKPHPSRGGNAYSQDMREHVIQRHINNLPVTTPAINLLREEKKYPCISTCKSWVKQYNEIGHIRPKRPTGNHYAMREVKGELLVQLALFRSIHPKATIDECRAYLHNRDPNVEPFSPSQIHRAEELLDLHRKAASTTAEQAYLPVNLTKRRWYWEMEYPHGMVGVQTRDILDIDEAGFMVESSNRKFGKVRREFRCDESGPFNRNTKLNLLLCVGADDDDCVTFHDTWVGEGTTLWRFYSFMHRLITYLAIHHAGRSFCFTMDNLNVHRNQMIEDLIFDGGHRIVYRAPYWSCDGSIEYVFNTIHTKLQWYYKEINNLEQLENTMNLIIGGFTTFKKYFVHVGFPDY
jgi:hypothetical protein